MSLPNSPNMLVGDRENVTEGYQSRPKSILKLRENTTMPIVSGSQRKVSFYSQVELRRFEFTPSLTYSGEDSENQNSDPPDILSSEFDEHPEEHSRISASSSSIDAELEENTNNDDESMELTGQLNLIGHLDAQVNKSNSNILGNVSREKDNVSEDINNNAGDHDITTGLHDNTTNENIEESSNPQQSQSNNKTNDKMSSTPPQQKDGPKDGPKDNRILEPFQTSAYKDKELKRLDDDANNISFTMSPYQERQILFLPNMTVSLELGSNVANVNKKKELTPDTGAEFRPLEALQDYADSLRDSLFNDTANSSSPPDLHNTDSKQLEVQAADRESAANDEEIDMELTQHVAVEWTEEVTMELTTQIAQPSIPQLDSNDKATEQNSEQITKQNSEDIAEKATVKSSENTAEQTNEESNEGSRHESNKQSNEAIHEDTNEETMDFTQPVGKLSLPENAPIVYNENADENKNAATERKLIPEQSYPTSSSQPEPSQEQEESTMEFTAVFHQEPHMLSIVVEEDENEKEELGEEETELPMELTQPILQAATSPNVHTSASEGITPLPRQPTGVQEGEQIQVDGTIIDRANTNAPVDTPAIIASQRELNRLIEEPTPNVGQNGLSVGGLGTPMREPSIPRRSSPSQLETNDEINLGTPIHRLPNHLHFETDFVPKIATNFAKRSLDPAIELKTSPSKRFSAHGPGENTNSDEKIDFNSPISLTEFLKDIEVKFFDDLEVETDLPSFDSLDKLISGNSFTKEDFYRANIHIPLLEVYELSCKELKGKISQGKNLYKELEKTANEEVPDLFRRYYRSNYYDQMSMKKSFQVARDYTREQAKQVWYEWRSKLFKNVCEVLSSNLELLIEDKQVLEARLHQLNRLLEATLAKLADIREDIVRFHKIRSQYQEIDSKHIQALKGKLMELNKQLLLHKEAILLEQSHLQEVNDRISRQTITLDDLNREIDDVKLGLMKLKHLNSDEIKTLEITSKIVQACSGLRFLKKHSKNIFEFEFSPKMSITVDIENTHSADGLVFHLIETGVSTLYNESLERYCQAIAETTPFLTIFETLALFRAKWLKLLSIDEQIYALSMLYPVTIKDYNEQEINFVMNYYSASSGLKVDFSVTIPVLHILASHTNLLISARVLKSRGKTTEKKLQETLSRPIAPYKIFRGVKKVKIIK